MIPGPIPLARMGAEQALDLFETYPWAEDYKSKTGQEAPPFDPSKPIKNWADPSPVDDGGGTAIYGTTIVKMNTPLDGTVTQHPVSLVLTLADARAVNLMSIKDANAGGAYAGKSFASLPVPQRPLAVGESFHVYVLGPGIPALFVVNDALNAQQTQQQQAAAGGFTVQDRADLQAIKAKLGA